VAVGLVRGSYSRRVRARACALFALLVGTVTTVEATPSADLVIVWSPAPPGRLGAAVADAATRAGAGFVDVSAGAIPDTDPRPLLRRGVVAYNALELDGAITALDGAAELVDQTGAEALDATQLVELFLYRALTHAARRDDARSWDDLVVVAGIDPTRVLDRAVIPPRAVERFDQAKAHIDAMPRARLTFVGGECKVRVDGSVVTTRELEVPFGRHWIAARCAGHAPIRRRLVADRPALEVALAGPAI
jgi:hypothetical protein